MTKAKCKLCNTIIESTDRHNMVSCSCGEISVDGGKEYSRYLARDMKNILIVKENGEEIPVNLDENNQNDIEKESTSDNEDKGMTKKEMLNLLLDQIKHSESLPPHVRQGFVSYIEFEQMLTLIYGILRELD